MARQRIPVAAVVLPAVFLTPLSVAGTAIALPAIAADLGAVTVGLQWAVNGFNVAFAIGMICAGLLADRFGSRRTFGAGLVIVAVSSAVSATALSLAVLDAGRLLAGIGSAAVVAGGSATISHVHPDGPGRARMFALFGSTIGAGLALGPTIMGALVFTVGWRGLYVLLGSAALVALLALPAVAAVGPTPEKGRLGGGFAALRSTRFVAFTLVPLVPAFGFVTVYTYLPIALAAVFDMSAAQAGLFMLAMAVPVLIGPMLAASLVRRVRWIRPETVVYASLVAVVVGDIGMLVLAPGLWLGWLVVPLMLLGLGYGLQMGLVDAEAISSVPVRSSGTAAGVLNFLRTGVAAVAVTGYGMLLAAVIGLSLPAATAAGVAAGQTGHAEVFAAAFRHAVGVVAVVAITIGVVVVWLQRRSATADGT